MPRGHYGRRKPQLEQPQAVHGSPELMSVKMTLDEISTKAAQKVINYLQTTDHPADEHKSIAQGHVPENYPNKIFASQSPAAEPGGPDLNKVREVFQQLYEQLENSRAAFLEAQAALRHTDLRSTGLPDALTKYRFMFLAYINCYQAIVDFTAIL